MSLTTSIPRFLLPQRAAFWKTRVPISSSTSLLMVRQASKVTKPPPKNSKPLVLEKPAKFNPPSHGSRLRKEPPRYPGPQLSAEEAARQGMKKYPHLMPPPGTFLHWFLNSRSIHIYITLGTLFTLATTVFVTNFKNNSPFADMLPHWSQLFSNPIAFFRTWIEVFKLNTAHTTAETQDRRKQKTEDVAKRAAYRKAHGLDKNEGFGGWTAKTDEQTPLGSGISIPDVVLGKGEETTVDRLPPTDQNEKVREKRPMKKWLGIW